MNNFPCKFTLILDLVPSWAVYFPLQVHSFDIQIWHQVELKNLPYKFIQISDETLSCCISYSIWALKQVIFWSCHHNSHASTSSGCLTLMFFTPVVGSTTTSTLYLSIHWSWNKRTPNITFEIMHAFLCNWISHILESHIVECSMESFVHRHYRS